jgi:hypothetical protein
MGKQVNANGRGNTLHHFGLQPAYPREVDNQANVLIQISQDLVRSLHGRIKIGRLPVRAKDEIEQEFFSVVPVNFDTHQDNLF